MGIDNHFLILNQIRTKIGVMYGDPTTTPGGKAIPFHSSVRIKLGAGQKIENKDKEVIGIHVSAKTIKNKVAAPFRKINFEIHFGVGIKEHEQVFDLLRKHGPESINDKEVCLSGTGAWKCLTVTDIETGEILIEKKFHKPKFDEIMLKYMEEYDFITPLRVEPPVGYPESLDKILINFGRSRGNRTHTTEVTGF